MKWIEVFRAFDDLNTLERKTIIHLIHSIRIIGKTELEIAFNYQCEYEAALALLDKTKVEGVA